MPNYLDLAHQVQSTLRTEHGGTGNDESFAYGVIEAFDNDTGETLSPGTLVTLKSSWDDRRVVKSTTLNDPAVIGPVVGAFYQHGPLLGQFESGASSSNAARVAVMRFGTANVAVGSNGVTRGHFAYSVGSNGQAYGKATLESGAFGQWVVSSASSNSITAQALVGWGTGTGVAATAYTINVLLTGGASAPPVGVVGNVVVDAPGTIRSARMVATGTGSAVVGIKKCAEGSFPGSLANICGSNKPTLASQRYSKDSTLSGWTTTLAAGDILEFTIDSISAITSVTCALEVRRT